MDDPKYEELQIIRTNEYTRLEGEFEDGDISNVYEKKLYSSLCLPSAIHSYSLCVEYIRGWFLSKFEKDYFKTIHIDGKHVFEDWRKFNSGQLLKRLKPSLSINPQLDFDFDNDRIDASIYGIDTYLRRSRYSQSFFNDRVNNLKLSLSMSLILMNFTFRIRVTTRAQQVDLYHLMKIAFRIGFTHTHELDMEWHIPYKLMTQVAEDSKFRVENGLIVDIEDFVKYLNKNSVLPIVYKYRNINGNCEFFLRVEELPVHIATPSISADDGEREGQTVNNFIIEMPIAVRFPQPHFYAYHSYNHHDEINFTNKDGTITGYTLQLGSIPEANAQGWDQFLTTGYLEENVSKPLEIDFKELLKDSELLNIIMKSNELRISPRVFLDIKIFNNFEEKAYSMDWDRVTLKTTEMMTDHYSYIIIYANKQYINEQLINIKKYDKNRFIEET